MVCRLHAKSIPLSFPPGFDIDQCLDELRRQLTCRPTLEMNNVGPDTWVSTAASFWFESKLPAGVTTSAGSTPLNNQSNNSGNTGSGNDKSNNNNNSRSSPSLGGEAGGLLPYWLVIHVGQDSIFLCLQRPLGVGPSIDWAVQEVEKCVRTANMSMLLQVNSPSFLVCVCGTRDVSCPDNFFALSQRMFETRNVEAALFDRLVASPGSLRLIFRLTDQTRASMNCNHSGNRQSQNMEALVPRTDGAWLTARVRYL